MGVRRRRTFGHPARRRHSRAHARGVARADQAGRGYPAEEGDDRARATVPDAVARYSRQRHEPAVQGCERGDVADRGVEADAAARVSHADAGDDAAQAAGDAPVQAGGTGQPEGDRRGGGVIARHDIPCLLSRRRRRLFDICKKKLCIYGVCRRMRGMAQRLKKEI